MKKRMTNFWPLLFALFSILFYLLLYHPSLRSEDFVTGLLVFFTALAWSAVIILTKEKNQTVYYIYISIAVVFPFFIVLFFKHANTLWHMVIICLYLIAVVGLRLYISSFFKRKKGENSP
jgi:hypothetical protein